jgi:hypothetical protein
MLFWKGLVGVMDLTALKAQVEELLNKEKGI